MQKTLLCLLFSFLSFCLFAQTKEVKGKVISAEDGAAMPGVNVIIKGTAIGTVTDADGNYVIKAEGSTPILLFTFIGMLPTEMPVGDNAVINITLNPDAKELSEVVVVGYGTEKKRLLTESVGVVKEESIRDLPVAGVDGVLQGQTAGVQVSQNSGTPGGAMSVRIRGTTSISGSGQPLYVIDGIPVTTGDFGQIGYEGQGISALTDLNPNDIETFTVLKDAAATAIYGARASNGIVLITTKRGKTANSAINFNAYYGVQEQWRKLKMLNANEWMDYRNDLAGTTVFTDQDKLNNKINTDWQKEIFRTAPMAKYELSTSGGDDRTKFYISGSYFDQQGILIGTGFKRLNGRVNLDHKISNKLSVGTSIGLTYSTSNRVESDQSLHGPLPNGISTPAIFPVYNQDGTYNQSGPYSNAVSIANEATNQNFTYRTIANIFGEYKILPGLTFTSKWGVDFYNLREHAFEFNTVQGQKYNGLGFETYSNVLNIVSNNILKYNLITGKHTVDFMAGYSFEKYQSRSSYIRGQDFPDENLQYISSAATIVSASADALDKGIRSYFGKANYNFADKYLLSLSGRVDASTNFGSNNRNGFFPAASAAWRIGKEAFIQDNFAAVTDLKIRASYGLTGNDNIPSFSYLPLYSSGSYNGKPSLYPKSIPNPNLKWETTAQFDVGIDASLFQDRLTLTVDYYNKQTKDLLQDRPLPPNSGFSAITENIGQMENKGIELTLGTQNMLGPVRWTSSLNLSFNRNKILKLYNHQPIDDLGRGGNRIQEGYPLGTFYNYKSLGVDPSTGDIVFADTNHDGEITSEDRTRIGNPNPKFTGGFTNTFAYKGFDLNVLLQFSYGNDVFNGSRLFLESLQGGDNQIEAVTRRWKKPGDITDIPRATSDPEKAAENKRASSRFIEDGSYLRIKNVTLGYNVNKEFLQKLHLSALRIYVGSQNLYTYTHYTGLDPEVNYSGNSTQVVGTDFFTFPQARAYTVGLNLKF